MSQFLLITESPAKAKKIQGFLSNEYTVKSSCGHITDLEKKKLSIDVDDNFRPTYKVTSDKKDVVKMLKENAKEKNVIFAADDDREGEAIAWHTALVLKTNLGKKNRIVFREISKKAIVEALKKPQKINMDEVNAQQARRLIDRLIGFKLSPCLWKHINTPETGLSAGRVQSALLNLLVDHEKMIDEYEPELLLDIKGSFTELKDTEFVFTDEIDPDDDFLKMLFKLFKKNRGFKVYDSTKKKDKTYPKKPFITSTLQQSAQNELGYPVKMTMDLAQKLYENGHITYMRTDSTFISEEFQEKIHELVGDEYYQKASEKKVKGAQEAHEAIRPTRLNDNPDVSKEESKLYQMIVKRTVTSHMKPAEYDVYRIKLHNESSKQYGYFTTSYRHLIFPGYLSYGKGKEEMNITEKPEFKEDYDLEECICSEKDSNKPSLYNESGIVSLLEDTGIGRPSTYAAIISTLGNRKYTVIQDVKSEDMDVKIHHLTKEGQIIRKTEIQKGKLVKKRIQTTPLGRKVLEYLKEHFMNILHKEFTVNVEKDLDKVATGKLHYIDVIRKVYESFITSVDQQMSIKNSPQLRLLGEKQGKKIYLGNGKFGLYLQMINQANQKKNIGVQKYLEMITMDEKDFTLDDAVKFLKYPKKINDEITINIGPYGYYMKYNGKNCKINQSGKYTEEYCLSVIRDK
jgi:DNA topoisomerase-1